MKIQKVKMLLLWIFSIVGLYNVVVYLYSDYIAEKEAKMYAANCQKLQVGMAVDSAKEIMGNHDLHHKHTRSEIMVEDIKIEPPVKYFLSYSATKASSTAPRIYFDPKTMLITRIVCGD